MNAKKVEETTTKAKDSRRNLVQPMHSADDVKAKRKPSLLPDSQQYNVQTSGLRLQMMGKSSHSLAQLATIKFKMVYVNETTTSKDGISSSEQHMINRYKTTKLKPAQ
jgi:hypothetical protein